MKYYSEVLEKFFDESDALLNEEAKHLEKIAKEEEALAKKKTAETARKKELAENINKCDEQLDVAYKNLTDVKLKCAALIKEVDEKVNNMLTPAEEAVKLAQKKRMDAISEFNKEFGVFKTTYTDERAKKELERTLDMFNKFWRQFGIL